ncbi:MAG: hypothetical protein Kow00124_27970 [Anaerolineae bacterium]
MRQAISGWEAVGLAERPSSSIAGKTRAVSGRYRPYHAKAALLKEAAGTLVAKSGFRGMIQVIGQHVTGRLVAGSGWRRLALDDGGVGA